MSDQLLARIARLVRLLAWLGLIAVAVLSVVPGQYRPSLGFHEKLDGALAFAVAGGLLGMAYRRHPINSMWIIATAACGLELAQFLAPGRHVHFRNAEVKTVAGLLGLGAGIFAIELVRRLLRDYRKSALGDAAGDGEES